MIDPIVEKNLESCRHLLKYWQQFRMFLVACGDPARVFTPQEEAQFLRLKSEVAMIYDAFFESLQSSNRESVASAQSIMSIVQSCITLKQVQSLNAAERRKFEIEWHESYMLVNETIAMLEDKHSQLSNITPSQHRRAEMAKKLKNFVQRVKASTGVMATVVVILLLVAVVAVFALDVGEINGKMASSSTFGKTHEIAQNALRDIGFTSIPYKKMEVFLTKAAPKTVAGYRLDEKPPATAEVTTIKEAVLANVFKGKTPETIGTKLYVYHSQSGPSQGYNVEVVLFKNTADAVMVCSIAGDMLSDTEMKNVGVTGELTSVAVWRNTNAIYFMRVAGNSASSLFKQVR